MQEINLLKSVHPVRLGFAISQALFAYEVLHNQEKGLAFARNAFENAISEMDTLNEDEYRDSTLLMQMLRDKITQWTGDLV